MALIEIDGEQLGLPIKKNGDFPWQTVSHKQRVNSLFLMVELVGSSPHLKGSRATKAAACAALGKRRLRVARGVALRKWIATVDLKQVWICMQQMYGDISDISIVGL
jgi:hypothetical protein